MDVAIKNSNYNQFMMCNLLAINQLADILGIHSNNPCTSGQKPYDKEVIFKYIKFIHVSGMPDYFYYSVSMLLDYYIPQWRGFVDSKILSRIVDRDSKEVRNWVKSVYQRDNHTCQDCGSKNNLHAHHIIPWSKSKELRISLDNGITLCGDCHHKQHPQMGKGMFA